MGLRDRLRKFFASGARPTLGDIDRALADGRRASGVTPPSSVPVAVDPKLSETPGASGGVMRTPVERAAQVRSRSQSPTTVVPATPQPIVELPEYRRLLASVTDSKRSVVLLLGRAGTGKSTAVRWLLERIGSQTAVLAPTGIAALNIGGQTIHSFLGLPSGWLERRDLKPPPQRSREVLKSLKYLVIDECSMVNANIMDAISMSLEQFGPRQGERFGGLTIILVGDLLQLPPVVPEEERPLYSEAGYATEYFFSAVCMREVEWDCIGLDRVMRQSDSDFVGRLGDIRVGQGLEAAVAWINENAGSIEPAAPFVTLVTSNRIADDRNEIELARLPMPEREYRAVVEGSWKVRPALELLRLRVGAQVIFLKNDPERRWVNGSLGTVERIEEDAIYVTLRGTSHAECVTQSEWERYEYRRDAGRNEVIREVVGRFVQYPLKPAWAITIHKAQGQTYDACSVDFGDKAFCAGQAYVALSRCRSIANLHLTRPLRIQDVQVDRRVLEFCEAVSYLDAAHREHAVPVQAVDAASELDPVAAGASTKGRATVFLSHATRDQQTAMFVRAVLERAGFDCWFAPQHIEATEVGFVKSLARALNSADLLLVLLSEDAQESPWVVRELQTAVNLKLPILPVWASRHRGRLSESFEFLLAGIQSATLGPEASDELPRRLMQLLKGRRPEGLHDRSQE